MPLNNLTHDVYRYALSHLEKHKAQLDELINHVRTQIGTSILPDAATTTKESAPTTKKAKATRKKRVFSAEGKARMVAAQKERWASFHAKQKETTDMLVKLERNGKKAVKKVTKNAATKASKRPVVAVKKAVKKAANKATKKVDNSDIPF